MTGLPRRDTVQKALHYAALIIVTGIVCFPLLWAISSSMKPADELFAMPPTIVPNSITMENYEALIHGKPMYVQHETTGYTPGTSPTQHFLEWFANSIIVAGGASLISVTISTLAAYSLTRFRYRGQQAIPYLSLVGYMMPPIVLVFPLFLLIVDLGLANNLLSLVLGYVALTLPFCTWMLWAFFRSLPIEVEEAGLIDGASRFQIFRQIVVPSALPGIIAAGIFSMIVAWNDYLFARIFINSVDKLTLTVGVMHFFEGVHVNWGLMMASAVLMTVPLAALFMLFQRHLVAGFGAGAVKG
jgi:ABC-type glycerol-3-phosphate transport system permease component